MSNLVSDFRQLSTLDMHAKLKALAEALDESDIDADLKEFAVGLIGHLLVCTEHTFKYVERMRERIEGLPQSFEARESLLAELEEYPFRSPTLQEKTRDRINNALVARPAPAEKKPVKKSIQVNGIEREFPEGWNP